MKIAQIAPLAESVPPQRYGGTERIVSYLTEELVRQGHDVTLFASGDSTTRAELHATVPTALRLNTSVKDPWPYAVLQLEHVRRRADEFDVLHFHWDYLHFPLMRALGYSNTAHHDAWPSRSRRLPGVVRHFQRCGTGVDFQISSVSRWRDATGQVRCTMGFPPNVCRFEPRPRGDYLAFLGRISPEKRVDRAIEIAGRAGHEAQDCSQSGCGRPEVFP